MAYEGEKALVAAMREEAVRRSVAEAAQRKTRIAELTKQAKSKAEAADTKANVAQSGVTTINATLVDANVVQNDGVAPAAPANVSVVLGIHSLSMAWDDPSASHFVTKSLVEVERISDGYTRNVRGGAFGLTVSDLEPQEHRVLVRFIDKWGLQSQQSAAITATPKRTAAEEINLVQLATQGRLSGLLPNVNLAPIGDASKFAQGVVENIALAAGQNANVLPWEQATFDNYVGQTAWPPAGVEALLVNCAAYVTQLSNWNWLRVTTTADVARIRPFSDWKPRGVVGSQTYIASCYAHNSGGGTALARLEVENNNSLSGSGTTLATGEMVSLPPDDQEHRLYVKFEANPTRPYHLLSIYFNNNNRVVDLNRFQIEAVDPQQTQPGRFGVPAMTFGVMSGRFLATMDAAIVNLVVGDAAIKNAKIDTLHVDKLAGVMDAQIVEARIADAAIQSAKIGQLKVDKLVGGTFTAGDFIVAGGGQLKAGRTILNNLGIQIPRDTGFTNPDVESDVKISDITGTAAMNFYTQAAPNNNHRGISFRALGSSGSYRGDIVLHALYSANHSPSDVRSAKLEVRSSHDWESARILCSPLLEITGDLKISGDIDAQLYLQGTVPANGDLYINHTRGKPASIVEAQVESSGTNGWIPLPTITYGVTPMVYVVKNNDTRIQIRNDRDTSEKVRLRAWFS